MLAPRNAKSPAGATRQGTPDAVCSAWFEAYGGELYRHLRLQLVSPDQAEDLTAEVFLRALRAFDRFDPSIGSPRTWLFRIARNALLDYRRQARRRQIVPLATMHDLQSEAPSPEERILWEEEVAALLAAIGELPPKDQEVIGLCYGSELSIADAGDVLGLSATATRTRLWRALRRLRKVLLP